MNIILSKEEALDLFIKHMEDELPIIDTGTGEEFIPKDGEYFIQCNDPNDSVRMSLPTRWFISNYGNLLSVTKKGIKRLKMNYINTDKAKKYGFYTYTYVEDGVPKSKTIKAHILMANVFGSQVYGNTARQLIQDKGIFAWKDDSKPSEKRVVLATHHESKDPKDRLNPEMLETTTEEVHRMMHRVVRDARSVAPKYTSQTKDINATIDFMRDFSELAGREAPGKMTVFFTGEIVDKKTGEARFDGVTKIEEHDLPHTMEVLDQSNYENMGKE